MNITQSFRRKNKYHKPIVVFKQLYRDYFKHNVPLSLPSSQMSITNSLATTTYHSRQKSLSRKEGEQRPKINKTRSAEQLVQYIKKHGDPGASLLSITRDTNSGLKKSRSIRQNTYVFRLLERNQLENIQKDKRSYFKDVYTKSHPIFEKNLTAFRQKKLSQKELHIPQILPQIFKQNGNTLIRPIDKRIELQQLKAKLDDRKQTAMEKFSKIRYNYLLKKNLKPKSQQIREDKNTLKNSMNTFLQTKQNIFPTTSQ